MNLSTAKTAAEWAAATAAKKEGIKSAVPGKGGRAGTGEQAIRKGRTFTRLK